MSGEAVWPASYDLEPAEAAAIDADPGPEEEQPAPASTNGARPTTPEADIPWDDPKDAFAHDLDTFLGLDLKSPPALLGTDDDTIIPTGGLVVIAGMPGAGKTTLILDAVFHLASGADWLGFPVDRPLNILLIENEGPQHKFQSKLRAKRSHWKHEIRGKVRIHVWNWGSFTFKDSEDQTRLRRELDENEIDIVIGDPLDTLGTDGVGSPENTREFVRLLVPLGLFENRTFIFLHHFRKEITLNEINQVSGAWGGRLDSLLVLKKTDQPDELRLSFPKLRWGDETHEEHPMILGKLRDTAGFELLRLEKHEAEPSADAVETMLRQVVAALRKKGGAIERQIIALHCDTALSNRTFTKSLALGFSRGVLAKEQSGRKVNYSLTEEAYL